MRMNKKRYFVFSLSAITIVVCYLFFYSDAVRVLMTEVVGKSLATSKEIYFDRLKLIRYIESMRGINTFGL